MLLSRPNIINRATITPKRAKSVMRVIIMIQYLPSKICISNFLHWIFLSFLLDFCFPRLYRLAEALPDLDKSDLSSPALVVGFTFIF